MTTTTVALMFAESSEAVRRECNVTLGLSFLHNFPSSEAYHKSIFATVFEMILFRTGIDDQSCWAIAWFYSQS